MDVRIKFEGLQGSGKSRLLDVVKRTLQVLGFVLTVNEEHEIIVHRPLKTLNLNLKQPNSSSNTTKKD